MTTTTRPRYLNLPSPQARHLHDTGSLLFVEACKPQPPALCRYEINGSRDKAICIFNEPSLPGGIGFCPPDPTSADQFIVSPLGKPGDVVFCTSEGFSGTYSRNTFITSVECRRVATITNIEAEACGHAGKKHYIGQGSAMLVSPSDEFAEHWDRRHRRRGPEFGFERAWGFFYRLSLQQAGEVRS
jgi:hypothetical protein